MPVEGRRKHWARLHFCHSFCPTVFWRPLCCHHSSRHDKISQHLTNSRLWRCLSLGKLLSHARLLLCLCASLPPPSLRLFVSGEAVFARCLSSLKEERVEASRSLSGPPGGKFSGDKAAFLEDIRKVESFNIKPEERRRGTNALCPRGTNALCPRVSAGSLCFQDHFLRAGFHAAATGGQRVWLEPQLRRHRSDVEGRLHHPEVRPRPSPTGPASPLVQFSAVTPVLLLCL